MSKSSQSAAVLLSEDGVRIPGDLVDLAAFRRWLRSSRFPERGRIDWIGGDLEVDLSPEDLNSHATPKVAIGRDLSTYVEGNDLGVVFMDSMRLACPAADLCVEPDVLVVFFESLKRGAVRLVRSPGDERRCIEVQGTPDLVVECVSLSSIAKDRVRLRERYAAAGIPEYWIVDARGDTSVLNVLRLVGGRYREQRPDRDGFARSVSLGQAVCLERLPERMGIVRHRLVIGK